MQVLIIAVVAIFGLVQADGTPAPVECMSQSNCTDTQCCYKKHEFLVVSKKRGSTFEGYPTHDQDLANTKGVCHDHKLTGDSCSMYDKQNGYCGCNEKVGESCHFVPQHYISEKGSVYVPGAGSYKCADGLLMSKK